MLASDVVGEVDVDVDASFQPMQGTDFREPSALVGLKRFKDVGMRLRPGTEGASSDPANKAWRPTHIPKNGFPDEICSWMAGR